MKRFEIIMGILFVISIIFRLYLIPGAGILCSLSLTLLACMYLFFGFAFFNKIKMRKIFCKESYRDISGLHILGSIGVGWGLATVCIGILFKLMFFPGGFIVLSVGLIQILIITIIALVKYFRSKSDFYKTILLRIVIIGTIGHLLCFTSDLTIVKIHFRNHPDYIKAYERYMENPQNEKARKQLDMEYKRATLPAEEFEMYLQRNQL
jgi:hypothetical protein